MFWWGGDYCLVGGGGGAKFNLSREQTLIQKLELIRKLALLGGWGMVGTDCLKGVEQ